MLTRINVLGLHLAIFFALTQAFEHFIAPIFGYEGYVFHPSVMNGYLAAGALVLLSLISPVAVKPSTMFYQVILVFAVIPILVLFYAEDKDWEYPAKVIAAYVFSLAVHLLARIKTFRISNISATRLQWTLLFVAVGYIAAVLLMGGAAYLNFDFSKVYDFRSDAADNLPPVFGYISPPIGKVIIPVGMILAMVNRKAILAFFYLICAIFVFGLTAHKSVLFDPFLVLFIYLISASKNLSVRFNAGMLIIILLSIFDLWMTFSRDNDSFGWIGILTLARLLFLPAEINYMYYDFFSTNEWVLFSDSKVSLGLLEFKYPYNIPNLIGREYFNSETMGANTGWFGSSYAQAGFFGLLLYGAAIAVIFKYIDSCAHNSGNRRLITASIVIPVFSFITSSDLPTTLLTHGLLLNLLLITCLQQIQSGPAYHLGAFSLVRPTRLYHH